MRSAAGARHAHPTGVTLPLVLLLMLMLRPTSPVRAQTTGGDTVAFLRAVTDASVKYRDRADAVRAGYRRVGPDFPGMGEHWVQPGRLVSGRFQPEQPPILTYVTIAGRHVLAGAAFALPLMPGEAPPDFPSRANWHDHSASVDEESLLIAPATTHAHSASDGPRPRLAMLHVWFGIDNPDGVFAQDNWALPFVRLAVPPPARTDIAAARALSFLSGGDAYYRELFRAAAPLTAEEAATLDRLTSDMRRELEQWLAQQRDGWSRDPAIHAHLARRWSELWRNIEQNTSAATWQRLAPFAPVHH